MKHLDILYCCSNAYAPYAGISLQTLYQQNPDLDLTVYLGALGLSQENRRKLEATAEKYERKLVFLDASDYPERLERFRCASWNGSLATWLRFAVLDQIPDSVGLLFNIDSDTLVTGNLSALPDLPIGDCPVGAVCDALGVCHRITLGLTEYEPYFNGGIVLFNMPIWRQQGLYEKMMNHLQNNAMRYSVFDQDLLNDFFRERIYQMPQAYNVQGVLFAYRSEDYFSEYQWEDGTYYSIRESTDAIEHPCVLHFLRFLGGYPWSCGWNMHPCKDAFAKAKQLSEWKDEPAPPPNRSAIFFAEKLLYFFLPRRLFLKLFRWFTNRKENTSRTRLTRIGR